MVLTNFDAQRFPKVKGNLFPLVISYLGNASFSKGMGGARKARLQEMRKTDL